MATPRGNKKRDVYRDLSSLPRSYQEALPEIEEVPQSSALKEISSTPRTRGSRARGRNLNVLPTVEQTPCRGPSKLVRCYPNVSSSLNGQNESGPAPMAVLKEEYPVKLTTTLIPDAANLETFSQTSPQIQGQGFSGQGIQETPVKGLKTAPVPALRASPSSIVGNENDECIYKSLGWDDEVDELM